MEKNLGFPASIPYQLRSKKQLVHHDSDEEMDGTKKLSTSENVHTTQVKFCQSQEVAGRRKPEQKSRLNATMSKGW